MEVRLFGPGTVVDDDGRAVPLGTGRVAVLVAALARAPGDVVTLDRLVADVWGDATPHDAEHAVRVVVSRARRMLRSAAPTAGGRPVDVLGTVAGGYVLRLSRRDVDVAHFHDRAAVAAQCTDPHERFRVAADALSDWDDEVLAGVTGVELVEAIRREVHARHGDLLEVWAEAALALGRDRDLIDVLTPQTERHPFRERIWTTLSQALDRSGRHRDAIAVLDTAREVFGAAGLELSADTLAVERRLHAGMVGQLDAAGDLPAHAGGFFGRHEELRDLVELVSTRRCVTLTGPGGVGKTRLASAVGRMSLPFDSVRWVDLEAVGHGAELVEAAIAQSFGAVGWRGGGLVAAVRERVAQHPTLVIVDNCEHVLEPSATAIERLVAGCPALHVLATSREPLRLPGEVVFDVPPLPVGDDIDGGAAVDLFVDRARAADRRLQFGANEFGTARTIVRRLDGIPLAIELAAAHLARMSLDELHALVADGVLGLDARPLRGRPRHQTLDATIRWSYHLLDDDSRRLLRSLSVFPDTFTGADAAAVAMSEDAPTSLADLVGASIVARAEASPNRYRLLAPIREFAASELRRSGDEREALDARDRALAAMLLDALSPRANLADPHWRRRVVAAAPTARLTIDRALGDGREAEAIAMASTLVEFLNAAGRYPEAAADATATLERIGGSGVDTGPLVQAARWTSVHYGDARAARRWAEALEHTGSDRVALYSAVGSLHAELGDLARAAASIRAAIRSATTPYGPVFINLAAVEAWAGRPDDAEAALGEALAAAGEDPGVRAVGRTIVAIAARMRGDSRRAAALIEQCWPDLVEHASRFHLAVAQVEWAIALHRLGDLEAARALCDDVLAGDDPPRFADLRAHTCRIAMHLESDPEESTTYAEVGSVLERAESVGALWPIVELADVIACHALDLGRGPAARALLSAASSLRARLDVARDPDERTRLLDRFGDDVPIDATADGRSPEDGAGHVADSIRALLCG